MGNGLDKKENEPDPLDLYEIIEKVEDKAKDKIDIEKLKDENKLLKEKLREIMVKYENLQEKSVDTHVHVNKHKEEIQRLLDHVKILMNEKEDLENQIKKVSEEKQVLIEYIKDNITETQQDESLLRYSEEEKSLTAKYKMKLVMIGDFAVGKTSFIKRFAKEQFSDDYKPTIGVAITKLRLGYQQEVYDLIMWDLTGQVAFKQLASKYMEDADMAILMYDVTRMETYESVKDWYQVMFKVLGKRIPCLLVGNKNDLRGHRKVSFESGIQMSEDLQLNFLEISVKEDRLVDEAIINLINQFLKDN